ncbi:uncharacterized protein LOC141596926 [Silene latifolia]|uniref:uncharacterized protein LOC141596926 n=1 Tax=Silene latifolia TaxID=37657 RepID=UPI003D76D690
MKLGNMVFFFILLNSVSSQLSPAQKSTMIKLSNSLKNQTSSISWNVVENPCLWAGVTCNNINTTSYITQLSLSNKGLTNSSFLSLACQIPSLEALHLSNNSLSSIPDEFFTVCGGIQVLKLVNFSSNRISGFVPSFGSRFLALESLDFARNLLSGSIDGQFSELVSLKSLNLSFNNLSGSIPVNLGKHTRLEQLQLSTNKFQGSIPEKLANYKNLTVLDLSSNQISGYLPTSFGELLKLEILVLSVNNLQGEIPITIAKIRTLQRFAAYLNSFTGVIPPGISKYINTLDLSYNSLSGSIPDDLLSHPNLKSVDVSNNKLVGSIPVNVSSSLFRLRAGGNSLNGTILSIQFSELQNLQYLELENNSLSGTIPSELGSCQKLSLLNLAGNRFSGELPSKLGDLKQLVVLSLQHNEFIGRIPYEITKLTSLLTLNISWNSVSGSIPPSISALSNLNYLHLQGNKLTGSIPSTVGSMDNLIELQLGQNQLSGNIVSVPTNLQFSLNLSHNLFTGPIPKSLDQLTSLEILDLSYNRFSGTIPDFLSRFGLSLTLVLLNNNNLSGVCPVFPPHMVVDTDGNPSLIRRIIPIPTSSPVSTHRRRMVAIKIAVGIGALLFGGLVAFLAVSISQRLLCRAHDREVQPNNDDIPLPKAIESHMLTTSSIHKANINFTTAMEAVTNPLNLILSTKFSSYYKVIMPSERSYFVKKINCSDRIIEPSSHESFGKELEALGKLNSSNIMIPLAYMLASDGAYLFYEITFKGTLFDVLHRSSGMPLDWVSRCSIAVGLAQGLASLHGCSTGPILLFDLGSKTVMLKSLREPQIGDIELCKVIDPSKTTSSLSAVAGSVGYIPPEYAYTMRVTLAGNVYSFGVILLELITGKQAVSEGTELAKWVWSNSSQPQKWDRILDYSVSRTSPAVKSQMLAVLKIALACINASSEARPKMKSVLRMLLNAR